MWAVLLKFFTWVTQFPFKTIADLLKRLVLHRKLVAGLSIVLFIAGTVALVWYYERSRHYGDIVNATLNAPLEPTAQTYKGLEAFMMSKVDREATETLKNSALNATFISQYQQLARRISTLQDESSKNATAADNIVANPVLQAAGGINNPGVLSDTGFPGFLFVPRDILRGGFKRSDKTVDRDDISDEEANKLLNADPSLKRDIIMSQAVAGILKNMLATQFVDSSSRNDDLERLPAQVYLVTSNGINRIFSNKIQDGPHANAYYGTQFSHSTFFPGRPYFQNALAMHLHHQLGDLTKAGANEGDAAPHPVRGYFYVSQPYMDLAGNGIVVTASRVVETYDNSIAILCLDFTYVESKNLSQTLTKTIADFNAPKVVVRFNIDTQTRYIQQSEVEDPRSAPMEDIQNHLIDHAKKTMQDPTVDLASFFGNIQQIGAPGASGSSGTSDSKAPGGDTPLEVSIPIGDIGSNQTTRSGDFLLFQLDLARYRKSTDLIGLIGCTCFGLFSVLLITAIVTAEQKNVDLKEANEELQEAFVRVGSVLRDAPTPYTLLDSRDRVRDCNKAFGEFMGVDISSLKGMLFRDLIIENDKIKYDVVQQKRVKNEPVEPYLIGFTTSHGERKVWVVSAAVPPTSSTAVDDLPETFGVLLARKPELAGLTVEEQKALAFARRVQ